MNGEFRERALLPVMMPLLIMLFIGVLAVGFALVLLAVPKEVAVAVALMAALNLLAFFSVISARKLGPGSMGILGVVAVVPIVVGGAVAAGLVQVEEKEHHDAGPVAVEVVAENVAFTSSEFKLAAGEEALIHFNNKDTVPHNVAIFEGSDPSGEVVFRGEIFAGPDTKDYKFKAPEPGSYYFHCDVHPNMAGTVVVEEAAGEGGHGKAAPIEVAARDVAFDTAEIEAAAGGKVTVAFDNQDTVPHNIAIFEGADPSGEVVFRGEIFTGPAKRDYTFEAPEAGSYYFHCDVHPNMQGTFEFS